MVDFPEPFVPINPHASPLWTWKLTSLIARNSWNINSCFTSFIKYSFRLSIFWLALLKRIVTWFTSTTISLWSFINAPRLNIQNKLILIFQKRPCSYYQHQDGCRTSCKYDNMPWKTVIANNIPELSNIKIHRI